MGRVGYLDEDGVNAVIHRRRNVVRSMVRRLITRYPLVLGMSLEKLKARLHLLHDNKVRQQVPWDHVIQFLRRSDSVHSNWLANNGLLTEDRPDIPS
jgi:hypothetical protein